MSDNVCKNCGNQILVTIFMGGHWCSDDCRKALKKQHTKIVDALSDNEVLTLNQMRDIPLGGEGDEPAGVRS